MAHSRTIGARTPDPLQTFQPAGPDVRSQGESGPKGGGQDISMSGPNNHARAHCARERSWAGPRLRSARCRWGDHGASADIGFEAGKPSVSVRHPRSLCTVNRSSRQQPRARLRDAHPLQPGGAPRRFPATPWTPRRGSQQAAWRSPRRSSGRTVLDLAALRELAALDAGYLHWAAARTSP